MMHPQLKRWLPALILTVLLLLMVFEARIHGITLPAALNWIYLTIRRDPWVILLIYAVRPPFILPISWLVLLCGTVWGLWLGGLYAMVGMMISAASAYAIARFTVPPSQGDVRRSRLGAWMQRMRQQGFMSLVLMRLMLLPFDMVNFAAAALHLNFRNFMLGTLIGNAAATLIYTSIGASVRLDIILSGQEPPLGEIFKGEQLATTVVLLALSLLVAHYVKKRSNVPDEIETD